MDAKLEQLEATLNNINVFNAGKKREEAVALLAQLEDQCGSVRTPLKKCSLTADDGASSHR